MLIEVNQEVKDLFPGLSMAFFGCASQPHSEGSKRSSEATVLDQLGRTFLSLEEITSHHYGPAYTAFYQKMGLKIKKVSTPLKQAARVYAANTYHGILPVIDASMALEYSTLLSFQVFDADTIDDGLIYGLAKGNEPLFTISGEERKCKAGELILMETTGGVVHSSSYGTNGSKRLSNQSKKALVRIMKIPGIDRQIFERVVQRAVQALSAKNAIIVNS